MSLALVTPPVGEVLTLLEIREHLRIDHAHDDVLLLQLLRAATHYVEGRYGDLELCLLTQTWEETLDRFPCRYGDEIRLTLAPVAEVVSITYLDALLATQTWPAAAYQVDTKSARARIVAAPGEGWPPAAEVLNAVTIRYTAGFGTRVSVPPTIRLALLGLVGHFYEHREAVDVEMLPVPMFVDMLLAPYRPLGVRL